MKMKKLVVGLLASALLVATVATTAFAASSPKTDTVTPTEAPSEPGKSSPSKPSQTDNVDVLASGISGDVIKYDGVDLDPTIPADLYKLSADVIASARAQGASNILKAVDAEDSSNHDGKGVNYKDTITVRFRSSAFKAGMKITVFHLADGQSQFEKITPDWSSSPHREHLTRLVRQLRSFRSLQSSALQALCSLAQKSDMQNKLMW